MEVRKLRKRFYKKTGGPKGIGNRCKEYVEGCIVCESYRYFDQHGRFPLFDEVSQIIDEINKVESQKHVAWTKTEDGQRWVEKCRRARKRRELEKQRQERRKQRRRTKRLARKIKG